MKKYLLCAASGAVLTLMSSASMAQSIDYTSMEEMFGEPVTTSATGKPQRLSDAPMTMEILTQDDIRRSGAVDLAEVLRMANGVSVVQKGEQQYDVSIRGYNTNFSSRLLVLLNGRQLYLDYYGFTNWATVPVQMDEIRQIEIVKGPNTALFGFNAVAGVINIVTYNPLYDQKSSAGITVGTNDYRKASYMQSFKPNDKLGIRISAGKKDMNGFNNDPNGTTSIINGDGSGTVFDDPQQENVNLDTLYQLTPSSQVRVEASASNTDQGQIVTNGDAFRESHQTKSGKVSYENDSKYGLIKANVYKNFMDLDSTRKGLAQTRGKSQNEVLVAQLEDTIAVNNDHTVRVQGEYRDNVLTSDVFLLKGAEVGYNVYALSAMWDWKISDAWSWNNAVRADRLELNRSGAFSGNNPLTNEDYDVTTTQGSYNSGLVWKFSDLDTFRLSTARGLEVPTLFEYGTDFIAGPITIIGAPRLKPTIVTNYELAWDRKINELDGMFRSAVFYQQSRDVKTYRAATVPPLSYTRNIGESDTYGFELELNGKIAQKFDWGLGYIYQDINEGLRNGKSGLSISAPKEFENSTPHHQINLKLGYKDGAWEADALTYYVSKASGLGYSGTSSVLEDIDSYVGMNARIGYSIDKDTTLALEGQQLLRSQTQTSTAPDVDRRLFLSLNRKF